MRKIVTIVGARPQFIKAAVVSRQIRKNSELEEIIVHTGQHFDTNMSAIFFDEMDIPRPDYNLEINSISHGAMTGRMLEEIENVLQQEKPDIVLVYGDTNSTLAGALAAKKLHIEVAHVEAGLRSFSMKMPEEINRILTDRISDILFCPTQKSVENLHAEGFGKHIPVRLELVGDVMYDAALFYSSSAVQKSSIIEKLSLKPHEFVLCTVHRQENTDDEERLRAIMEGLNQLSKQGSIVFPMHPRTRKIIEEIGIKLDFKPIEPLGYFDIVELLKKCKYVITDSGGMQKEAYFFEKGCFTLRDETEWVELVGHGVNRLIHPVEDNISGIVQNHMFNTEGFNKKLYGNGDAGEKIVNKIIQY